MLHYETYTATTSYSKVLRGLRFPLEVTGIHTSNESSGDTNWGQQGTRYAIHARRHSNDKVFRSHLLLPYN